MARLVIVDPAYASSVGHHGEVNRPLLQAFNQAGWRAELWADVRLEAEPSAPGPLRGVFSGCGYEDPALWRELGGVLHLARRMEEQLALAAAAEAEPVAVWLGHSLLPFQLLGLARHLAGAPAGTVLLSLMFAPGETLQGGGSDGAASAHCRVALAALARAAELGGHRLLLTFPSQQQEQLYGPLLAATGLRSAGVHPAVVGAGCRPPAAPAGAAPLVLLHWGDLKHGKGRQEALGVLQALVDQGVPGELGSWGWLFHSHSLEALSAAEQALLDRAAAAAVGLEMLSGEVDSQHMAHLLGRCPLALLAYHPGSYGQRSSGILWQWLGSRLGLGLGAVGVGYPEGWLARESRALGVEWQSPRGGDGAAWLAAVVAAAAQAREAGSLSVYGRALFGTPFASWCRQLLEG